MNVQSSQITVGNPAVGFLVAVAVLWSVAGCDDSEDPPGRHEAVQGTGDARPGPGRLFAGLETTASSKTTADIKLTTRARFVDIHESLGLDFVYQNGSSAKKLMPVATGGGGGWCDFDADGWPDLFLPQGGDCAASSWDEQPVDRLFQNLDGLRFKDITAASRLIDIGYGHAVTIGDFDNDGFDDFYVSNVGEDILFLNLGDGTFLDVTAEAGMTNPVWSSSGAWGDIDLDGDLDLYVCNYVNYDPFRPISCIDEKGVPATCHPKEVDPISNVCFVNLGDGTFVEQADQRGLTGKGRSLGVVIADFSLDGLPDIYVANDITANHLFINIGKGRFAEEGLAMGCSMSGLGQFQASMGIAFGDYDRNGWPDLYVTHFTSDSNTLYQNVGAAGFTDSTRETGLHNVTLPYLAFGTVMADFDLDGWQDLFVTNGHIDDWRDRTGDAWKMPAQFFQFDGVRWHDTAADAGDYFKNEYLGRAVATGDFDRDGDLDIFVNHQNDNAALLENASSDENSWIQLSLIGRESNRKGIGSRVVVRQGATEQSAQLAGGTSYCASQEPILQFGLGRSMEQCEIQVLWPSGRQQILSGISVNQRLVLQETDAELK